MSRPSGAGIVAPWILMLPFALVFASLVLLVYGAATGGAQGAVKVLPAAVALLYLGGVLGAAIIYKLARSYREHSRRHTALYRSVAEYLSGLGLRDIEAVELGRIAGRLGEPRLDEKRLSLIVAAAPPALVYALYRLNQELYEQEMREAEVLTRLAAIAEKHHIPVEIDVRKRVTPRSGAAAIAALATGGALGMVWAYSLAREVNEKALDAARLEGSLARLLELLRVEKPEALGGLA